MRRYATRWTRNWFIEMRFYDTHAHFPDNAEENRDVLERAVEAGVTRIVAVGATPELNASAAALAAARPAYVRLALGFDRDQAGKVPVSTSVELLRTWTGQRKLSAIGEIGLDFHYTPGTADEQRTLFAAQLQLANELGLPVVIHTREAEEATLEVLDEVSWRGVGARGVVHCFTGDKVFASKLLDRQLAISFSGIVTFRNADMLRESAAYIPDERLLIETDSPYLAPVPLRSKRNEPAFIRHVAECLARVRSTTLDTIAELTYENAARIFGL